MAHNFKRTDGQFYISQAGHDSNDGLTPDTPFKTIKGNGFKIVGAGTYSGFGVSNENPQATADGKVVVDFGMIVGNHLWIPGGFNVNIEGFEFKNCVSINGSHSGLTRYVYLIKCKLKNFKNFYESSANITIVLDRSIGIDLVDENTTSTEVGYQKSILINSHIRASYTWELTNSHIGRSSIVELPQSWDNPNYFTHNNINGILEIVGSHFSDGVKRQYAIKDQYTGTPQDAGYPLGVKWLTEANLTADGYTFKAVTGLNTRVATCINRDPLFNNQSIEDFSLKAGSPLIGRASDGTNIGGRDIATNIINEDHGVGDVEIIASPQINTSNPRSFTLNPGETEGYIDYIQKVGSVNVTLGEISPLGALNFNSDFDGGTLQNNNVPDSEPLTYDYPRRWNTTSVAADTTTLNVTGHDAVVGEIVRVLGQDRQVTAVTASTITVGTAFRAAVGSGVSFQVGSFMQLAALKPNRLTFQLRTSKQTDKPTMSSDWDNDIDPFYNMAGQFLTQEWDKSPGYVIDVNNNRVLGSGDSEAPNGLTKNEITCKWVQIRVYIRNNYDS